MPRKQVSEPIPKGPCRFSRKELILRFWRVIPSTLTAVERLIGRILRVARAMECAQGQLPKVEIALREALHNAIMHGSRGDAKKKVSVCCLCAEDKGMLLVVRDFGPGFDPTRVPDPTKAETIYAEHGRGIFLMRQMMDRVRFQKGGRQVVMKKAAASRRQVRRRSRAVKPTETAKLPA